MINLKIYDNCKADILSGISLKKTHADYMVGKSLFATTDIGRKKKNQEDSVLILEHPQNKDIKIIGVSDGVGGLVGGDIVSNHVVKKLMTWFENLDANAFNDMNAIKNNLYMMLANIMEDCKEIYGAATLSAAIVGETETLIVNIGDSRIYTYQNGKLKQETIDDSEVQFLYDEEIIPSKELMRFHKTSNVILQAIEGNSCRYIPRSKIIKNDDYDRIYAFTDGATDCLSKEQIENIIKQSKHEAAHEIVKKALSNNSILWDEIDKLPQDERKTAYEITEILKQDYYQCIDGGKDNTSAVEYRKR